MSTGPLRQSKRLRGIEASPEGEVRVRRGANETEAQPEVTTKVCVSTGTQTTLVISYPAPCLGAESGNLFGSSGERANRGCNYRKFLRQRRPRDSGLGERTVVDPDDSGEEAGAKERSATYPPLPGSKARWDSGDLQEDAVGPRATPEVEEGTSQEGSDWHGWRSRPISSGESSLADSVDEEDLVSESSGSSAVSRTASPLVMAQRPPAPQLKSRASPIFYGRKDEDAVDWLERYESTALLGCPNAKNRFLDCFFVFRV
ncbi:hypothetical protein OUZ56_032182 [Daphnia magna]|uniref:Uncharacterized protein n=1 Tax=Daphnia magna TaxID=35525 RepID=A0ABQ9ZWF9_9CRUS|nr:hypothetical protein OUZ56_032182 [Daphnia magna]